MSWLHRTIAFGALFLIPFSCHRLLAQNLPAQNKAQGNSFNLVDVTEGSGIDFVHTTGAGGEAYIIEGMASGMATFDYDNDGFIDIYFLTGGQLRGTPADRSFANRLYRNNGNWTFTDVTNEAGVGHTGHAMGVTVGDYDGDGDEDIYVLNFGPNVLYRNNGDRTFTDVTDEAGVGLGEHVGAGASFFDMDGDEDLDLYVANYVDFNYQNHKPIVIGGKKYQAGPAYYGFVPDVMFRNDGNGKFTDVSVEAGISGTPAPSMGTIATDFDDDGDIDVYVAVDTEANLMWANDGHGKFEDVALICGMACDFNGRKNSSMGVDCADYDNDGLLDYVVTSYQSEIPALYRNLGGALFEDAGSAAKLPSPLFADVEWGCAFADFDNDADQDLFIACGHFDRIEDIDDRSAKKLRNYLLANDGRGRFSNATAKAGSGLAPIESSRGACVEDFDNDGDLDIVILNADSRPTLVRNETPNLGSWLELELIQPDSKNPRAVGARVTTQLGGIKQTKEIYAGRGYQSHFGTRQHFGFGAESSKCVVQVRWPGGQLEEFECAMGQIAKLRRGSGRK